MFRYRVRPRTSAEMKKVFLHPAWTDQFFKYERVDVYYNDDTPKSIVALQMYDPFGSPTTKYTTSDYTSSQNASPASPINRLQRAILTREAQLAKLTGIRSKYSCPIREDTASGTVSWE